MQPGREGSQVDDRAGRGDAQLQLHRVHRSKHAPHSSGEDLNRADESLIARVPGIGVLSARRLGALRRERRIRYEDLTRLRCVLEKAKPFIVTQDYRPPRAEHESVVLRQQLRDTPAQMALW